MKNVTRLALLVAAIGVSVFVSSDAHAFSGDGLGQDYNPFVITTCEQLQEMHLDLDAYYILGGPIDCNDTATWNSLAGFEAIGTSADPFTGVLDGRNNTIDGLFVERATDSSGSGGLFGHAVNATIENIDLTDADITFTAGETVGGLVGTITGGSIRNVEFEGSMSGVSSVGGLVGSANSSAYITQSSVTGSVTNSGGYTGGLVSFLNESSVNASFVNATVISGNSGGGLVARTYNDGGYVAITNSYTAGSYQDGNYRAGILGFNTSSDGSLANIVWNNFTTMLLSSDGVTPSGNAIIANDTSSETVPASVLANVFDASQNGSTTNCVEGTLPAGCVAVNADGSNPNYFKNNTSVAPFNNWDFDQEWEVTSEYPAIRIGILENIGESFVEGDGSELDPYRIDDCEQLQAMRQDLDAFYYLSIDIDCTDTENWNGLKGFDPVGDDVAPFTGQLDGNDKTITGLYIDRADDILGEDEEDEQYVGLFGAIESGAVVNLSLVDTYVKGYRYVGGIVGHTVNTNLSNLNVNLTTEDNSCNPGDCIWARWGFNGGGIVGYATAGTTLSNVHTGGPVKGSGNYIGGIAGEVTDSTIAGSSSISHVDGGYNIGGIAGGIYQSTVTDTYATGSVTGTTENSKTGSSIGGFAGTIFGSTVEDSYATGDVEGDGEYIGGFGGSTGCGSEFVSVYAEGDVQGVNYVGGFSGSDGCMGPGSDIYDVYTTGNVTGSGGSVAGLIGQAYYTEIYEGYSTGNVSGAGNFVGGIFGFAGGAGMDADDEAITVLSDVYATGDIESTQNSVGGLIGATESYEDLGILVDRSFSRGDVSGTQYVGGLVGNMIGGRFDEVYAAGNVTGETFNIGGAIGQMLLGSISNAYASGDVEAGDSYVGGFLGALYGGTVEKSYSSGSVTIPVSGSERAGGFAGEVYIDAGDVELYDNFTVSRVSAPNGEGGFIANFNENGVAIDNNYYDVTKTGIADCTAVSEVVSGCSGVNLNGTDNEYFINNSTSAPLDEWDFASDLWQTQEDAYPCFVWQNESDYPCGTINTDEDLNGDGTPDSEQPHVGGYISPITGKLVAMDMGEGCELTTDDIIEESDNTVQDPAYVYENGLFDFEADCTELGYTTTIQLFYYDVDKEDLIARKYNPNTNAYFNLEGEFGAVVEERTINGQNVTVVIYELTDGGDLDMDLVEDGNISDPAGLASSVLGSPNTGLNPVY